MTRTLNTVVSLVALLLFVASAAAKTVPAAVPRALDTVRAEAIVHGVEEAFDCPGSVWCRLLLYTPPLDYSVVTQAFLVAQFSAAWARHQPGTDPCITYGEAAAGAASTLVKYLTAPDVAPILKKIGLDPA